MKSDKALEKISIGERMTVILFNTENNPAVMGVKECLQTILPKSQCRCCTSLDNLTSELRTQSNRPEILILSVRSEEEMDHLIRIGHLFDDIKTVLITQDSKKETLLKASRLYPRYISNAHFNTGALVQVVTKIIKTSAMGTCP